MTVATPSNVEGMPRKLAPNATSISSWKISANAMVAISTADSCSRTGSLTILYQITESTVTAATAITPASSTGSLNVTSSA